MELQEVNNCSRLEYILNDRSWYMRQMNPGQGVQEGLHKLPTERDLCFAGWHAATIPGDVYSDLQRAGAIDDPYVGRNLVRLTWVQHYEWWYICRFNTPDDFANMDLQLVLEGVDYSCEVWLNGTYLGEHEGMFSPIKYNVTRLINSEIPLNDSSECENSLAIKIAPAPQSLYNIAGKHHTFSGDYLPGFVPVGIWRDVKIIATKGVQIEDMKVESKLQEDIAQVAVTCEMEVKKGLKPYDFVARIYNEDGDEFIMKKEMVMHAGTNEINFQFDIENPKIWWSWDMGDQPLYFVEVVITDGDLEVDRKTIRFGIREVKMAMNPGYTPDEAEFPWTFVINGKEIFLRSGCWGGPPSFFYGRNTSEKYRHFITLAKECNLNNIRMFGWHPPEVPEFYDLCDELGITVWTNFPLSSQVLRDDTPYVNSVLSECLEIIKERRNHPSNIFWMGGEEVYFSEAQVRSHNKRMMKQVGKVVAENTDIPYADASMMSSRPAIRLGYKPKECIHANGAYYAAGNVMIEDYFPKIDACMVPELAAASAPCIESLKRFVPENELWPIGPTWCYLQANIDILRATNFKILGDEKFSNLEEFVDATQVCQGEIFKFAIESFRRRKPHMSGVAICHFITNKPMMKWEIVDYYGVPKKSFYYVQTAYQPLLASLQFAKRRYNPDEEFAAELFVVNDQYKEYKDLECRIKMTDDQGNVIKEVTEVISVSENSSEKKFDFAQAVVGELGNTFDLEVDLVANGDVLSHNCYTLLIADQEEARIKGHELYQRHRQNTLKYGKTMYRDFPELCVLD